MKLTTPTQDHPRQVETVEDDGVGTCSTCGDVLQRGESVVRSDSGLEHADHVDEPLQPALPVN